jgi:hypothetical protein
MIWYLAAGFVVGWLACWYLGAKVARHVFRRPESEVVIQIVSTMPQERLLNMRDLVLEEVRKRQTA